MSLELPELNATTPQEIPATDAITYDRWWMQRLIVMADTPNQPVAVQASFVRCRTNPDTQLTELKPNGDVETSLRIDVGARIATSSNLSGKTTTAGVADALDVTLDDVSGPVCEAIVIYKDTGSDATSPLIAYIDTSTGLPITPNGSDIHLVWDSGNNRIFRL